MLVMAGSSSDERKSTSSSIPFVSTDSETFETNSFSYLFQKSLLIRTSLTSSTNIPSTVLPIGSLSIFSPRTDSLNFDSDDTRSDLSSAVFEVSLFPEPLRLNRKKALLCKQSGQKRLLMPKKDHLDSGEWFS